MSRYDGLIIPRSYSEYINKTDAATLQQALQLSGVLSGAVAAGDNKAVKSSAVNNALSHYERIVYLEEDYASYTNDEFVAHLTTTYNIPNGRSVTFIFNNNYGKRVGIKDFLGGSTQYDFICGKCTVTRIASGQISIMYDINTYHIGSYRYYENILAEYSITTTGQGKWNYYVKDTDLTNTIKNYKTHYNNGVTYWKLPRKDGANQLCYFAYSGGFMARITGQFLVREILSPGWELIQEIASDDDYIYLKCTNGFTLNISCLSLPISQLEITYTTDATEYNTKTKRTLKTVTLA